MSNWTRIDVPDIEFKEANEAFRGLEFENTVFEAKPVVFNYLPTMYVDSEWRVKDGNIEAHVFHRGRVLDRLWNHGEYAYALFNLIVAEFSMETYQDRITVEFIPEVNGWYVLIKGVAMLKDPDPNRLVEIFNAVRP